MRGYCDSYISIAGTIILSQKSILSWWKRRLSLRKGFIRYYFQLRGTTGCHIVEEDWDNLIILDGCRYDLLKKETLYQGNSKRRSVDSATPEFLKKLW